ncbi:hypothetical protein D3C77_280650 [compost metagenome]
MIVYDIHHHADAFVMQALNHFLEFADSRRRIARITGISSFRHIVVLWIVSPIVFRGSGSRVVHRQLVDRLKIIGRQQMQVRDSK